MKCSKTILKNGLRVLTTHMPTLESATLTVWVATGSRKETRENMGISHFLEHMAFKGGKKYKSAQAVSSAIDAIGGDFNAGTSKEWTNFYVRTRVENIEVAFDVLSDMLLSPSLKQADIDREKGVIIEEMNMYEDTPMYKIGDIFEELIFDGNSLGWDIIGTKDTVTSLTRKDFASYRDMHYKADNMILTISGGIKKDHALALSQKYFGELEPGGIVEIDRFSAGSRGARVKLKTKKTDQAHLMLGFLGRARGNPDRYVESVLATILGAGMSSRLFTEVREKRGLAYSVQADVDSAADTGYIAAHAGLDPTRIEPAIKVILDEFYKIASSGHGITKSEFAKAKEYIKGHVALSLESTTAINTFFGMEELFLGQIRTPEDVFAGIDAVTIKDIVRVARETFDKNKLSLAIIGPYKDKGRFEKLVS